jgi:hypothetical protein
MGVILKNNGGLISTILTDVGRRKISQGNFNVSYFQVGDSEVNYTAVTNYSFVNSMVLQPQYNSSNNSGVPSSTKNNVKYPFYLQGNTGVAYGIPYQASSTEEVFNTTTPAGFFQRPSDDCFQFIENGVCYNSQYVSQMAYVQGVNALDLIASQPCAGSSTNTISAGTKVAIWILGQVPSNSCNDVITNCIEPSKNLLFYTVVGWNFSPVVGVYGGGLILSLDRPLPKINSAPYDGILDVVRLFFYNDNVANYDLPTPFNYYTNSIIDYESVCYPTDGFVRVWNMNIPWSESPAGTAAGNETYKDFKSYNYLGTKEYYGYSSISGQTDTSGTWYYNSFGDRIDVSPKDQKAIAIVHYTNNTIINWYGEKFACEVFDSTNPGAVGQARNFQIVLPFLNWHKAPSMSNSTIFYIDPPGFEDFDLLTPNYIQSSKNSDMNNPGIRYYHLYDTNPAYTNGPPNRVGKVFPDDRIIIFDDEEIVAALSYSSNRSWTLPAPRIQTTTPGSCDSDTDGVLNDDTECLWVTYVFKTDYGIQGLHCNYYQKVCGPNLECGGEDQNVIVTFGGEFGGLTQKTVNGWWAKEFYVLAQKTNTTDRPDPAKWKAINFTQLLSDNGYVDGEGFISSAGLTSLNFTISQTNYDSASLYNLSNQVSVRLKNDLNPYAMNFGEETFFHGYIETDIQSTIYEMRYLINLPNAQFTYSSNPTWTLGQTPYMTEIGLYDTDKNLLVLSKFQSPQLRQGIQQAVVKLDF